MLFNSLEFALFLPIVFLLYWGIDYMCRDAGHSISTRLQNALIVIASYIFYGWWDWRFLLLIAFTTLCSYFSGIMIVSANTGGVKTHSSFAEFRPKNHY